MDERAGTGRRPRRWRKVIYLVAGIWLGFMVVAGLIGTLTQPTTRGGSAAAVTPAPRPRASSSPALPQAERDARSFIASRYGRALRAVQVRVEFAWAAVALAHSQPTQANVDELAQVAQTSHDDIDALRGELLGCPTNHAGTLQDVQLLLSSDAGEVKNAMGALVAYCGTPNAATLASFTSQYEQARTDWDRDVRTIWAIARKKKPPTF